MKNNNYTFKRLKLLLLKFMVLQDTKIYQDDFNALLKTALLKIFNKNAELSIRYYKKYLLLG